MKLVEKKISSRIIYKGKILNLRLDQIELPDQSYSKREIIEHSGGVAIIPVLDDQIILIKQYRSPAAEILLELPAGKIDPGEEHGITARRELQEETGYQAGKLEHIYSFYSSPGYSDEIIHLYLAEELLEVGGEPDQGEFLEVFMLNKEDIKYYLKSGKIKDAKTITGLLEYLRRDI
ncbi:MAG: NUDIX domain-containing protein [Halanaerobiales bacterium]